MERYNALFAVVVHLPLIALLNVYQRAGSFCRLARLTLSFALLRRKQPDKYPGEVRQPRAFQPYRLLKQHGPCVVIECRRINSEMSPYHGAPFGYLTLIIGV